MKRTKPDRGIGGFLPAIFTAIIFGLVSILYGMNWGIISVGLIFIIYGIFSLIAYFRTRALNYLIAFSFLFFYGIFLITSKGGIFWVGNEQIPKLFMFIGIISGFWLAFLFFSKRAKWRGKELLELAADRVEESRHGFTDRPLVLDKVDVNKSTLKGFANFVSQYLIAFPFLEHKRIVFGIVSMGKEFPITYGFLNNYRNLSWIAIDYEGVVTVRIHHNDYMEYQDTPTFDKLANSLGQVLIEFYNDYRKGEGNRVLYKLDSTGIPFYS
jgi:hypothetical protein